MSNYLFWSPLHGKGQTSNMIAVGLIMSLFHNKKVLMMQTHFAKNNLEAPLVGQNVKHGSEDNALFSDIGLDTAITYSSMKALDYDMLEHCCLTFDKTPLLLLPGTETKDRETFDRDVGRLVGRMILDAEKYMDLILVDSNGGNDDLSIKLMEIADMIIINLTQSKYVLDQFFNEYGDQFINNKKAFYLFGDYDDNSSFNINNCRRKYKKYIRTDNSGVIPYCTKYLDSQNESNTLNFMQKGLRTREYTKIEKLLRFIRKAFHPGKYEKAETDYFFHRSKLSVEKMFDLQKIPIRKERREA